MFLISQIIINVKQITQCYLIYLKFVKIRTQCYLASFDLLYLYNFNRIANLNAFTIDFFLIFLINSSTKQIVFFNLKNNLFTSLIFFNFDFNIFKNFDKFSSI